MKDSRFRKVERVLYDLPKLRVEVQNLRLDLEDAKEIVGIRGASGNEKAGSSTNAFSSVVENEVLQREKDLRNKIATITHELQRKERELQRIENALKLLTEKEMLIVEFRYFKDYSINRVCDLLDITPTTFNKRRKRIVEDKLIPLISNKVHEKYIKSV